MSDSDEIVSSDEGSQSGEEEIYTSDATDVEEKVSSGRPSTDMTIEDSDASDDADESIAIRKNRAAAKKKRAAVIDSESEEEEEDEIETRALSPRTRMSITGIRPADLTEDSSEIDYSDEEKDVAGGGRGASSKKSKAKLSNISEVYDDATNEGSQSDEEGSETEEEATEQEESPEKSSVRRSFLEESAEENSELQSSSMVSAQSQVDETSPSSMLQQKTPSPAKVKSNDVSIINSPALPARYSTHFESAIKNKLSSTLYRAPEMDSSNDSDIQIIERKEKPIEISSSDTDEDKENSLSNSLQAKSIPKAALSSSGNLVQPKITAALNKVPNLKNFTTPTNKADLRYVSQEYYDKEIKKFEDLKGELLNAEKLLEKISKSLPDGGRQLSLRIERLRQDCVIKAKYIASMQVEDVPGRSPITIPLDDKDSPSQKMQQLQQQRKAFFNNQAPDWDELSAAVNQIQPTHTGKQGMATFNNQKALTVDRLKVRWS